MCCILIVVGRDALADWHDKTYVWGTVSLRRAIRELNAARKVVEKGLGHPGNPTFVKDLYQGDVAKMVAMAIRDVRRSRYGQNASGIDDLSHEICECLTYAEESISNGARSSALTDIDKALLALKKMLNAVEVGSSTAFKPWMTVFVRRKAPKRPTQI